MTEDDNTFTLDRYQSGHPGNGDCNSTTHDRGQSAGTGRKCILGNPTPQAPGKWRQHRTAEDGTRRSSGTTSEPISVRAVDCERPLAGDAILLLRGHWLSFVAAQLVWLDQRGPVRLYPRHSGNRYDSMSSEPHSHQAGPLPVRWQYSNVGLRERKNSTTSQWSRHQMTLTCGKRTNILYDFSFAHLTVTRLEWC